MSKYALRLGDLMNKRISIVDDLPKQLQEVANVLGLRGPLKVDDVTIGSDKLLVVETDPLYTMEKVVTAFDDISKTVALKLSSKSDHSRY